MPAATKRVTTALLVENGALLWRVSGDRGTSPNRRRGVPWAQRKRDRDKWRTLSLVADGRHEARAAWCNPPRATILIREWGFPKRDRDNGIAANKETIDAIVHATFLADDTPDVVVDVDYEQPDDHPDWIIGNRRTPAVEIVVRGE